MPEGTLKVDNGAERDVDWTVTRWSRQCVGLMVDELILMCKSDLERRIREGC